MHADHGNCRVSRLSWSTGTLTPSDPFHPPLVLHIRAVQALAGSSRRTVGARPYSGSADGSASRRPAPKVAQRAPIGDRRDQTMNECHLSIRSNLLPLNPLDRTSGVPRDCSNQNPVLLCRREIEAEGRKQCVSSCSG